MAKFFGVSVDELLTGNEALAVAREDHREQDARFRDRVFGVLDCASAAFLFLPLFAQGSEEGIREVSLLALTDIAPYMKAAYLAAVLGMTVLGLLTFALRSWQNPLWQRGRTTLSLALNAVGTLLFILSPQPYAGAFLFVFLAVKVLMLTEKS